jgi:acetamidase/formamidase
MKQFLILLSFTSLLSAADVSGIWSIRLTSYGEEVAPARVTLRVEAGKLTGALNELKLEGTAAPDGTVNFTALRPNGETFGVFEGKLGSDEGSGIVKREKENFTWKASRLAAIPNGPPQTHTFVPTQFHRYFSGSIPPALHIKPGDTVITTTVDAGGTDSTGTRRSNGGNPETGPFYIDGALPGDTLAVKFTRIRLNRDFAESGNRITTDALNAGYVRDAKYDDKFDSVWKLNREAGYATLAHPTERLKNFRVKLQPMMGCVGVAPSQNQSLRSGWLGDFGGNMDFNGLREGTTVYLPVNQAGALLFVGDGHAAQGDGELTGDALETSMDVEFTVNLIHDSPLGLPRAENDEFIMALGIANSLPEALRQATTRLTRWIEKDYGLNPNEAAMVLGTSIRYDIAEIVDPQVNVVAKLSKQVLSQIAKP